jgi:hypothetical protein
MIASSVMPWNVKPAEGARRIEGMGLTAIFALL